MLRLTQEQEKILAGVVEQHKNARNPFQIAARDLPYSPRLLNHYYRSHLNPALSHHDLSEDEKYFIDEWISTNWIGQRIEWKTLVYSLKERHGYLRSENKLKNYWHSKQNQQKRKAGAEQRIESCPFIREIVYYSLLIQITAMEQHLSLYFCNLALCQPANVKTSLNNKTQIYGVLPCVTPGVLRRKEYNQVSDIYGFGVIAYEVCTGLSPYHDMTLPRSRLYYPNAFIPKSKICGVANIVILQNGFKP